MPLKPRRETVASELKASVDRRHVTFRVESCMQHIYYLFVDSQSVV